MQKRAHTTESKHKLNDFLAMKFEETDPNSLGWCGTSNPNTQFNHIYEKSNRKRREEGQKINIIMK